MRILDRLVVRVCQPAFESVRRSSESVEIRGQAKETEISLISKISKLGRLASYLNQHYPEFVVLL